MLAIPSLQNSHTQTGHRFGWFEMHFLAEGENEFQGLIPSEGPFLHEYKHLIRCLICIEEEEEEARE